MTKKKLSDTELGKRVGISRERVRQLRARGDSDASILNGTYRRMHPAGELAKNEAVRSFAVRVRGSRIGAGFSQDRLARDAGISRATVNAIESGATDPTLSTICALAQALKVEPAFLLKPSKKSPAPRPEAPTLGSWSAAFRLGNRVARVR